MPSKTKARRKTARNAPERAEVETMREAAPLRRTWGVRVAGWLSELADQPQLISLCAATTVAGIALRDRRLANTGARMLAAELVATAMKDVVKHRVDRTRPRVIDDGGAYERGKGGSHDSALNSFPSGHTAGAVAVARAVVRDYPGATLPAYAVAAGVGGIQMPRGQHYPSDVAAGTLVGLAAEGLVWGAERLLVRLAGAPRAEQKSVPPGDQAADWSATDQRLSKSRLLAYIARG